MVVSCVVLVHDINLYSIEYETLRKVIFTPFVGIVSCSITIVILGILIMFPLEFRPYAILCCIWGLIILIDGYSPLGFLIYMLGILFAFHAGFFKTYDKIKIIIVTLFLIVAIISQARFSAEKVVSSILNLLALVLIFGLAFLLFLPEIKRLKKQSADNINITYLPAEKFTTRDMRCLKKIQDGEKYESISTEEKIGLSTLKKRMKMVYKALDVYDKTSFLATYAGHTIQLKPISKTRSGAFDESENEEKTDE